MTTVSREPSVDESGDTVAAGCMPPWQVDELIPPPSRERRSLVSILGPGILLAGSSIGAGEWLFGPGVTALYGGTLLWLAATSIIVQVFYNLEVMRYALYCGEPIFIGYFRTPPGPRVWMLFYVTLFFGQIWPFMASNAAVPLAAAILGHLPGERMVSLLGFAISESAVVKVLGFVIFYAAFVPLIFGGKVYTVLERVMAFKLFVVLIFLVTVVGTLVSWNNIGEILSGFVRFGSVALRAETVVAGPHFSITQEEPGATFLLQGSIENGTPAITRFTVKRDGAKQLHTTAADVPTEFLAARQSMIARAAAIAQPGRFYLEASDGGTLIAVRGGIRPDGDWNAEHVTVVDGDMRNEYDELGELHPDTRTTVQSLLDNKGFVREQLWTYWYEHGCLPDLDWGILAAFAAIAGAGGMSNCLLSNFARDKGWGMGAKTGAIPSAIGGRNITLSHVGKVFPMTPANLEKFRGWMSHIRRDQFGLWMVCSFVGLALPCMMSLQFIRNVPVSGNRVAALTAEGISSYFPSYAGFWWSITLLVSFLALAPNAVMTGDMIARMWTDLLWVSSRRAQQMQEHEVKYLYYAILFLYCVWGSMALAIMNPLQIAKVGAVLGNIALGASAFHTLYVNRALLPSEIRPNLITQLGLVATGVFFLTITVVAAVTM